MKYLFLTLLIGLGFQSMAQNYTPEIPKNFKIAYISYANESPEIFLMNPNTKEVEQLTSSEMSNSFPQDYGDGKTLLFTRSKTGNGNGGKLFTLNIHTKKENAYNPDPIIENAKQEQKNKQGTYISYTKKVDGFRELFIYNVKSKAHEQVSDYKNDERPALIEISWWSPDGTKVAYLSGKDYYNLYLRVYDMATKKTTTVTPKGHMFAGLVWLKDNNSFVMNLARRGEFSYELFRIDLDGTNFKQLTNDPNKGNVHPDISPDGNWIVFESGRGDENHNIFIMHPDGTNLHKLTSGPAYHGRPVWFEIK